MRRIGFILLFFSLIASAEAQTTSEIRGLVRDTAGAVFPGVTLSATSPALIRGEVTTVSDDRGNYRFPALQAGTYQVRAELPGFATEVVTDIDVGINRTVQLDIVMQVAAVEQEITVRADAVAVRTTDSDFKERINSRTIDDIPLNGRQFLDLMKLTPGVAPRPQASDQGADVTVFGERSITNSFLIDGLNNDDLFTRNFSEFFNQDAIQEFEVLLGGFEAEFGRAQGAITNVITKGGTNSFHGRGFFFLRDDSLDSSNVEGQEPPPLERQELGGTIGGPIVKDKLFFFDSFQYFREERGFNFDQNTIPPLLQNGFFSPSVGPEDFNIAPLQDRNTNFFRLDYSINESNTLFFSYNLNREDFASTLPGAERAFGSPPPGSIALPSTVSDLETDTTSLSFRHTGLFSQSTFLESAFKYRDLEFRENADKPLGAEQLFPITFGGCPQCPGVGIWLTNASSVGQFDRDQNVFQWTEGLSYIKGDHSLKLGVDLLRNEINQLFVAPQTAIIGNPALQDNADKLGLEFTAQLASNLTLKDNGMLELPDERDRVDFSTNMWGFYAQDEWQPLPGVTLNLGVRYDFNTNILDDDNDNIAPRLGFAWDIGKNGKTVIRAGFGRYYDMTILESVVSTPSLGGIQGGGIDVQVAPRGFAFTRNPQVATPTNPAGGVGLLQDSGIRWTANALFASYYLPEGLQRTAQTASGTCSITGKGRPYIIYELLGIPVDDIFNPPVLSASTIPTLTGGRFTAQSALELLNTQFGQQAFIDNGLTGCVAPAAPQFGFLGDRPSASIFQGNPLIFRFRQLEPTITFVQTVDEPNKTPFTDSFNIGVEQDLGGGFSLEGQLFIRRAEDLLSRRIVNLLPRDLATSPNCAGNTTDAGPCNAQLTYQGFLDSESIVISLKKRYSNRYSFLLSYTYTDATDNFSTLRVPPRGGEISFLFNNEPELDIGRSLNTPEHNLNFAGGYDLPLGFNVSGQFRAQSGSPFNAVGVGFDSDGDQIFDNRLIGTEKGQFETDPFYQVDLRIGKTFEFGESMRLSGFFEVFNLFNRDNPFIIDRNCADSDGDGVPDVGGCDNNLQPTFGKNVRPLSGREIQLGARFEF